MMISPKQLSSFFLLILTAVSARAGDKNGITDAPAMDYVDAFRAMRHDMVWPLPQSDDVQFIIGAFAPEVSHVVDAGMYKFNRGMDIQGELGAPVVASYKGTVIKLDYFNRGGLHVVLEHAFAEPVDFYGTTATHFYTLYFHLSGTSIELGSVVNAGTVIGNLGNTGDALFVHLHHELRVGSRCSLSYVLKYMVPGAAQKRIGSPMDAEDEEMEEDNNPVYCETDTKKDPHVSPALIYPSWLDGVKSQEMLLEVVQENEFTQHGVVQVTAPPDTVPDANRFTVQVVDTRSGLTTQSVTLDLNQRLGFNSTTRDALNTPDTTRPFLRPLTFGYEGEPWRIQVIVPRHWLWRKATTEKVVVSVTNVWNTMTDSIEYGLEKAWARRQ